MLGKSCGLHETARKSWFALQSPTNFEEIFHVSLHFLTKINRFSNKKFTNWSKNPFKLINWQIIIFLCQKQKIEKRKSLNTKLNKYFITIIFLAAPFSALVSTHVTVCENTFKLEEKRKKIQSFFCYKSFLANAIKFSW